MTRHESEEFRRFGHEIVDWIADYLENNRSLPVMPQVSRRVGGRPAHQAREGEPMSGFSTSARWCCLPSITGTIRAFTPASR